MRWMSKSQNIPLLSTFIYLKHILHLPMMILEEMMEIQDMGKVLYISLMMRVHSFIKKGGLNINLGDV